MTQQYILPRLRSSVHDQVTVCRLLSPFAASHVRGRHVLRFHLRRSGQLAFPLSLEIVVIPNLTQTYHQLAQNSAEAFSS